MESPATGYVLRDDQLTAAVRRDVESAVRDSRLPLTARPRTTSFIEICAGVIGYAICVALILSNHELLGLALTIFPTFYFLWDLPKNLKARRSGEELVVGKDSIVVRSREGIAFSSAWESVDVRDIGTVKTYIGFKYLRSITLVSNEREGASSSYTLIKSAYPRTITGTMIRKLLEAEKLVLDESRQN